MKVVEIPVGSRLFDTIAEYTPTNMRAMADAGADGFFFYLGGNATADAIANAHAMGKGACIVSYSRKEGWIPSEALGEADATTALLRYRKLGVPLDGLVDDCDLEGCGADPTGYVTKRTAVLVGAEPRIIPGGYVGAETRLTGAQLYALPFQRYHRSCSKVEEPACSWSMIQLYPPNQMRGGVEVDINFACQDFRGRSWSWVVGG